MLQSRLHVAGKWSDGPINTADAPLAALVGRALQLAPYGELQLQVQVDDLDLTASSHAEGLVHQSHAQQIEKVHMGE